MFKPDDRVVYIGKSSGWENRFGQLATVINVGHYVDGVCIKFDCEEHHVYALPENLRIVAATSVEAVW